MRIFSALILTTFLSGCLGMDSWIHEDVDASFTQKTFTSDEIKADIDYLAAAMQQRHPAFNDYVNKDELEAKVAQLKAAITSDMTRKEAFKYIGQLSPMFNDGHSILFPLIAEFTYAEEQGIQTFPFGVKINDGKLFLASSYTRDSDNFSIAKGTEISAINGHRAQDIIVTLAELSHGETALLRESVLSVLFQYWLFAVFDVQGDIAMSYVTDKTEKELTLATNDSWQRNSAEMDEYELSLINNETGYLRIGSFDVDHDTSTYSDFIEQSFATIKEKGLSKLIIDISGNTGGQSDAGAEVIQYLINKPVPQASHAIEKLTSDNNGLLGYKGNPGEVIELDVKSDGMINPIAKEYRFNGEVIVVIDRLTYSAGILFATTILDNNIGTLVGEPTGGFANQTGNLTPFYLPNTKLLMLAPARYIIRPSGDMTKQPVMPHHLLTEEELSNPEVWLSKIQSGE